MKLKITTLIENNPNEYLDLYHEHGLSLYIEANSTKILFDTGKSGDFIKNAKKMNIDLNNLDYVLLSHGHYDHTGGLMNLVDNFNTSYKLLVGEGFFYGKYKVIENGYKHNGNSFTVESIHKNNISIKYIKQDVVHINENIMVFANFKSTNEFEFINNKFKVKKYDFYEDDLFLDEIALGIKTPEGLVLVVGCSHIGIVNILESIINSTNIPIYSVIGGTHLVEASENRIDKTIQYLKDINVKILGFSHCTGESTMNKMEIEFKEKFIYNNTGNVIELF